MFQSNWLKAGAAGFLSLAMLAGCGDDNAPQMEQEQDAELERDVVPGEENGDSDVDMNMEEEEDEEEN